MIRLKGYVFPNDIPLLCWVVFWLLFYSVRLRKANLIKILDGIDVGKEPAMHAIDVSAEVQLEKIWKACTVFISRGFKTDLVCLRRAVLIYRWCKNRRIPCRIFIGVSKCNQEIKGHAWVEIDGRIYQDDPQSLKRFVVVIEH